jgi:NADH-quinone oxidoreductase subunit J
LGASVFIISGTFALALSNHALSALHSSFPQPKMEASFGGIDSFGMILFTDDVVPLELSAALLLVAVVGVLAVAQGHVNGSGKVLADLRATARRAALRADEARGRST